MPGHGLPWTTFVGAAVFSPNCLIPGFTSVGTPQGQSGSHSRTCYMILVGSLPPQTPHTAPTNLTPCELPSAHFRAGPRCETSLELEPLTGGRMRSHVGNGVLATLVAHILSWLASLPQMPSGHGKKELPCVWLVDFKGEPFPTTRKMGTTGQLHYYPHHKACAAHSSHVCNLRFGVCLDQRSADFPFKSSDLPVFVNDTCKR